MPFKIVASYGQAALYLGRDTRTVRRWEGVLFAIDRTIARTSIKWQGYRVCDAPFKTNENRNGYCPSCSRAGAGRRSQAAIMAKRHCGAGNPNYVNGRSQSGFRQRRGGKEWARAVLERDGCCRVCGGETQLQAHHVLPVALFPDDKCDVENGITLCCFHHTELHRLELDLRLLPSLYASKADALPWHEALGRQDRFRELR